MKEREEEVVQALKEEVKSFFKGDCTGHDAYHTLRVLKTSLSIQRKEGGDPFLVAVASLLHDVDDYKLVAQVDPSDPFRNAERLMREQGISAPLQEKVLSIVGSISFKGTDTKAPLLLEGKIVQDADRLDAIGAIGIARAFAYGGHKGSPLHDPSIKPNPGMDFETYKKNRGSTVNHFYEKLLLLEGLMNTEEGRRIASHRTEVMKEFLDEFYAEWEGRDL